MAKKYKVLDLFAGAGGFSLGFKMAGFDIIGAIEIDKWASDTYKFNHETTKVLVGDISAFDDETILNSFEKPDIIIGGPPCQGFSISNKNSGDPKDPRNSLFREYIRVVKVFNPEVIVMENVPNIIKAKTTNGELVIDIIRRELELIGYNIRYKILAASDYGVPQKRQRFILIGTRRSFANVFPAPDHYVSEDFNKLDTVNAKKLKPCPVLWDAISDLPDIDACEGFEEMYYSKNAQNSYQELCRTGSDVLHNHVAMKHSKRVVDRFSHMTWGQSIVDIKIPELMQRKRNGNGVVSDNPYDQNNRRMHPNKLCNTITASFYGNFVHPYKNRNFTAREGARIQSFPDWYVFKGKPTVVSKSLALREGRIEDVGLCQYAQIGNAVPPLMAKAIAEQIMFNLLNEE